jgi:hypothetical protein
MRSPLNRVGHPGQGGPSEKHTQLRTDIGPDTGPAQGAAKSRRILGLRFAPSPAVVEAIAAAAGGPPPARASAPPPAQAPQPTSHEAWLDRVIERLSALRQRFPGAFRSARDPGPWSPLAIGIHRQIRELAPDLACPRQLLRAGIARYIRDWRYGHTAGAVRIDLDAQPAGEVTAEQADRGPRRYRPASSRVQRNGLGAVTGPRGSRRGRATGSRCDRPGDQQRRDAAEK